jgi:FKBP-type peptidyl-prolyl cis-trans isomerase (trigger factor)
LDKKAVSGRLLFYMTAHSHKHFENLKTEKLADGNVAITGELTLDVVKEARSEAIKSLSERLNIDGFRKGNVPESVVINKVGEMGVLEEVAEMVLASEYGNILRETKISPIGRPQIAITKLSPGIPLEFKITVTPEPEFVLPDYKKIAKEVKREENFEVDEKEVDAVLAEIEKRGWKPELKEGEDLRTKARENLMEEKKFRAKEKHRLTLIESLVKATELTIPKMMVDQELAQMLAQFKNDVASHKMVWEEYLKSIKKTEDDIRKEWEEKALSRVKAEMIMFKISETEKLEPTKEELEHETSHLLSHHKEADPMRVRMYVYEQLKNQKVFEFLETL